MHASIRTNAGSKQRVLSPRAHDPIRGSRVISRTLLCIVIAEQIPNYSPHRIESFSILRFVMRLLINPINSPPEDMSSEAELSLAVPQTH